MSAQHSSLKSESGAARRHFSPPSRAELLRSTRRYTLKHRPSRKRLPAESLVERAVAVRLAGKELRTLRRLLSHCRACPDDELAAIVSEAATRLLGRSPSEDGMTQLQLVCRDANKLDWFHKPSSDAVQIMTLHSAKGLEFDIVFHADLYDHVLPARSYPLARLAK